MTISFSDNHICHVCLINKEVFNNNMSKDYSKNHSSHVNNSTKSKPKAKQVTHLYMNGRNLEEIKITGQCDDLKVLYLHENRIQVISNLENFKNLSHLYLQWNRIKCIDNLNCLHNLKKLYLGNNMIKCLQNIDRLHNLQELHIEQQELEGEEFTFNEETLKTLARNLEVLNISGLHLNTLEPVSILFHLKHLIANNNCFDDAREIGAVLGRMILLEKADIQDCPAQKDIHFREKITAGSHKLQFLNGKFITPYNRLFIKRFEEIKSERRTKSDTDTKCKTKNKIEGKKSSNSLTLQHSRDELNFRAWNSLNFIQKPVRRTVKKEISFRPRSGYSLEGRNIIND